MGTEGHPSAEVFHRHARRYDAWFASDEGRAIFPAEVEAVRLLLGKLPRPYLEVGVGTGAFAQALGVEVGVDPARGVLRLARERGLEVLLAGGEVLPFRDGAFGAVLMVVTICFLERPGEVIRECARVLKPGGGLIVGEIERDSAWGRFYQEKKRAGHPFYSYASFYTLEETRQMMQEAGLRVAGYSSTLLQPPGGTLSPERAYKGIAPGASFLCIQGRR